MRHYPQPQGRDGALSWIDGNRRLCLGEGFGLRLVARDVLGAKRLIAVIRPDNVPSRRVAEKIGLPHERDAVPRSGLPVRVHAAALGPESR